MQGSHVAHNVGVTNMERIDQNSLHPLVDCLGRGHLRRRHVLYQRAS
jgi:hypothetical protein